ncbi:MAG TPA: SRPBCC family protein, partial [Baekduia sp.]|nr:SRPBCC family protein [Baekduia sp.]
HALADLKTALEATPMDKPSFVYTTFIKTTPERLWQGLTDPSFTVRYWNTAFETDWKTGSAMTWKQRDVTIVDDDGQHVVEADPYTRLSYTWHTFTPEWARVVDVDEERRARLAAECRSKVTFEIEPIDSEQVKLTVIHDDLEPDGLLVDMISGGWPRVIANLKTLLETGEPLPDTRVR